MATLKIDPETGEPIFPEAEMISPELKDVEVDPETGEPILPAKVAPKPPPENVPDNYSIPERQRELSMFPMPMKKTGEEGEALRFLLPMLAGGAASLIPVVGPGTAPEVALGIQGMLGGAAALGTQAAMEGKLPSLKEAETEIASSAVPIPGLGLIGKGLEKLGIKGLINAFKINKLIPKAVHTPPEEVVKALVKEHAGITGTRGAIEKSYEAAKKEIGQKYDALFSSKEGRKVIDAEVVYNLAKEDAARFPFKDEIDRQKIIDYLDKQYESRVGKSITKSGYSNLKTGHDIKVAASKKADFGNPDKSVIDQANALLSHHMENQLKATSKTYENLSEEAKRKIYQFKDFLEASSEQEKRKFPLGLLEAGQALLPATTIAAHGPAPLVAASTLPLLLTETMRHPSLATLALRSGKAIQDISAIPGLPGILAAGVTGKEHEIFQPLPPDIEAMLEIARKRAAMAEEGAR